VDLTILSGPSTFIFLNPIIKYTMQFPFLINKRQFCFFLYTPYQQNHVRINKEYIYFISCSKVEKSWTALPYSEWKNRLVFFSLFKLRVIGANTLKVVWPYVLPLKIENWGKYSLNLQKNTKYYWGVFGLTNPN